MTVTTGSASIVINRPIDEVFAVVTDITRMGDWSPESTGGRWLDDADGPGVGARFEGDNAFRVGPLVLKRWTTTSEVTACNPNVVFEFSTEGHTLWRYAFEEVDGGTRVTESFSHPPYTGVQALTYGILMQRRRAMTKGMEETLERLRAALET